MKIPNEQELQQLAFNYLSDIDIRDFPAGTQRPEDVPLWPYFGRDVPDHNRTKIGRIRFLTYFSSAMSEKFP